MKETRNQSAVRVALEAVRKAAEGTDNIMPSLIQAVNVYATLGEICDVLREVFGEYRPAHTIG